MNSTLKLLLLSDSLVRTSRVASILRRTFLSPAYQCEEAWNRRLEAPMYKKLKPIDLFMEMDQKFQFKNRVAAVDIDIFANIIRDKSHADELADVLYKLRMTNETSNTLDSTHHAVVRYYLSIDDTETLLTVLNDRLNYGIFCDYHSYNLLMDHLLKKSDYAGAAQVASFLMLQEEFAHPISNALALYSCHKYLENPDSWQGVDPASLVEEPKEEVKVRVRYLRNPYFDEHFDLWRPRDLTGKTLAWVAQEMDDPLGRSCRLRGTVLFGKYAKAIELIKRWREKNAKDVVYEEVIGLIRKDAPEVFADNAEGEAKELRMAMEELERSELRKGSMEEDLKKLVEQAVERKSDEDVAEQVKIYAEWETKRVVVLERYLAEVDKEARLAKIEEIKKDLVERERVITFFENEERIELEIERKLAREREIYGKYDDMEKVEDENYVPPEITRRRKE